MEKKFKTYLANFCLNRRYNDSRWTATLAEMVGLQAFRFRLCAEL